MRAWMQSLLMYMQGQETHTIGPSTVIRSGLDSRRAWAQGLYSSLYWCRCIQSLSYSSLFNFSINHTVMLSLRSTLASSCHDPTEVALIRSFLLHCMWIAFQGTVWSCSLNFQHQQLQFLDLLLLCKLPRYSKRKQQSLSSSHQFSSCLLYFSPHGKYYHTSSYQCSFCLKSWEAWLLQFCRLTKRIYHCQFRVSSQW